MMSSCKAAFSIREFCAKSRDDRGQASMMLVALLAVLVVVAITASLVARRAVERSLARNAADALALGALVGDDAAPSQIASSNGIDDFWIEVTGSEATASVIVGDMGAEAIARRVEGPLLEAPATAAVMARLTQLTGREITYQVIIPDPVLGEGQPSLTVEIDSDAIAAVLERANDLALCRPDGANHPNRFRLC